MSRTDLQALSVRRRGFTLVEVIVVLAVILLLTGIAVPLIGGYVEDGRRARAESEVRTISAAVLSFYKDLGNWPTRNSSGTDNSLYVLTSGDTQVTTNPYLAGHSFATWAAAAQGDILDNHLLRNTPQGASGAAYPTTGSTRWRGPYVAGGVSNDPWGRPYVVNVISGWYAGGASYKRIYVISAGPDGIINTAYTAQAIDDIAGDDIGMILNERR